MKHLTFWTVITQSCLSPNEHTRWAALIYIMAQYAQGYWSLTSRAPLQPLPLDDCPFKNSFSDWQLWNNMDVLLVGHENECFHTTKTKIKRLTMDSLKAHQLTIRETFLDKLKRYTENVISQDYWSVKSGSAMLQPYGSSLYWRKDIHFCDTCIVKNAIKFSDQFFNEALANKSSAEAVGKASVSDIEEIQKIFLQRLMKIESSEII